MKTLRCDMKSDCSESVTHIDEKGFIYCQFHGKQRKLYMRCRQLKPKELKQLQSDKPLNRYEDGAT